MPEINEEKMNRAILVGLNSPRLSRMDNATDSTMEELAALLETAGGESLGVVIQNKDVPDPGTFIGDGKVDEVRELVQATGLPDGVTEVYRATNGAGFVFMVEGKGYGDFKLAVAEVTADALAPVQAEYGRILADKAYVDEVLKNGAERASRLANRTVSKVYRKVGLLQLDK